MFYFPFPDGCDHRCVANVSMFRRGTGRPRTWRDHHFYALFGVRARARVRVCMRERERERECVCVCVCVCSTVRLLPKAFSVRSSSPSPSCELECLNVLLFMDGQTLLTEKCRTRDGLNLLATMEILI